MRWINVFFVLAVNAVPFYGAMFLHWSVSTILVLYWIENLALIAMTGTRIVLHRKWTRKRGHWTGAPEGTGAEAGRHPNAYLVQFAAPALLFTLAHGLFVIAIAAGMTHNHPNDPVWRFSLEQFRQGALSMCALIVVQLLIDLGSLRHRSFTWLKNYVDGRMARVYILHLALIFGMIGIVFTHSPLGLLAALMLLKTIVDLAAVWSAGATAGRAAAVAEPPAWAQRAAGAIVGGEGHGAEAFIAQWKSDRLRDAQQTSRCEETMPE